MSTTASCADVPVPTNPIEYLVYRLQGRWTLDDEAVKKIGKALYQIPIGKPKADVLALTASELTDDQLHLLFDELPEEVVLLLDDIQV
jgi:hypothetical protein